MSPHRISSGLGPPRSMRRPDYLLTMRRPPDSDWVGRLAVTENEINHLWIAGDRKAEAIEALQAIVREHMDHIEKQKQLRRFLFTHWRSGVKLLGACLLIASTMINLLDVNTAAGIYKKAAQFQEKIHQSE